MYISKYPKIYYNIDDQIFEVTLHTVFNCISTVNDVFISLIINLFLYSCSFIQIHSYLATFIRDIIIYEISYISIPMCTNRCFMLRFDVYPSLTLYLFIFFNSCKHLPI